MNRMPQVVALGARETPRGSLLDLHHLYLGGPRQNVVVEGVVFVTSTNCFVFQSVDERSKATASRPKSQWSTSRQSSVRSSFYRVPAIRGSLRFGMKPLI